MKRGIARNSVCEGEAAIFCYYLLANQIYHVSLNTF